MSVFRKLASQTAIYGIPTIAGRFLNYLLVPLYTSLFLPEEYGVVTKLYALVAFFNVLLTYGMETTYFRFASTGNAKKVFSTALHSVICSSFVFLVLAFFNRQEIATLLRETDRPEYISYLAYILFFDAVCAIPLARLRQENRAGKFALVRSVNIFSNILFNLFFLLLCPALAKEGQAWMWGWFSTENLVGYIFVSNLLSSGITFLFLVPEMRGAGSGFDAGLWKKMIRYSLPLLLVGFAGIVNETFDRLMLEYLLPSVNAKEEVGIYGAVYKLSIVMSLFIQAFRFAAEPFFFSEARSGDRKIYARTTHYFSLFCLAIFLLVSLYIDVFKLFLRNEAYYAGLPVVPVLLLANLFLGIYFNLSIWYKLADKTMTGAYISVAGAVMTVAFNFMLIPVMGYHGSAWATLAVYFAMCVITYLAGKKHYPVPYRIRAFFFYLIFTLALFLLSELCRNIPDDGWRYAVKTLIFLSFIAVVAMIEKPKKIITSQQENKTAG
jgi:O-antigen/teichoic acid export membrane protein